MNTLGQNIKTARLAAHMSQEQLAERIPISPGAISHYENDRYRPQFETLEKIAEVLGVSMEELQKSDAPIRTGRVKDVFPELDEEGKKLLRNIWNAISQWAEEKKNNGL